MTDTIRTYRTRQCVILLTLTRVGNTYRVTSTTGTTHHSDRSAAFAAYDAAFAPLAEARAAARKQEFQLVG